MIVQLENDLSEYQSLTLDKNRKEALVAS